MRDKPVEYLAKRRNRRQRFGSVAASIDYLHDVPVPGRVALHGVGKKPSAMFSIPDMAVAAAAALLLFGPDKLPGVARKAGKVIRDIQNTSQSFIREMERAADAAEPPKSPVTEASLATVSVPPSPPVSHPASVPGEPTL